MQHHDCLDSRAYIVDLSTGSLLGQNALAFTLTAFIALSFQRRLVLFMLLF